MKVLEVTDPASKYYGHLGLRLWETPKKIRIYTKMTDEDAIKSCCRFCSGHTTPLINKDMVSTVEIRPRSKRWSEVAAALDAFEKQHYSPYDPKLYE